MKESKEPTGIPNLQQLEILTVILKLAKRSIPGDWWAMLKNFGSWNGSHKKLSKWPPILH